MKGCHPSHYYKAATKGYSSVAKFGKNLGRLGNVISIWQMYNKEQIKVSNVAGIGMTFFTAASPIGWAIAG